MASIAARARAATRYFQRLGDAGVLMPAPNLSNIARALGHDDTAALEGALRGDCPLSFSDGDRLCELLSLDPKWLEDGNPLALRFQSRAQFNDCSLLLREFVINGVPYEQLFFVLSDEPDGSAMIIGHNSADDPRTSWRYDLLVDQIPIHDAVGGTGRAQRREFADLIVALYDREIFHSGIWCVGRIVPSADYAAVASGFAHLAESTSPYSTLTVDSPGRRSHWHEDFWSFRRNDKYTDSYAAARVALQGELADDGITNDEMYRAYIRKICNSLANA